MAGRMSYTFFWTGPTADEIARARAFKMLMDTTVWAAQSAISSLMPMIPWAEIRDWIVHKIADASDTPALKDLFAQPTPPIEAANNQQSDPNIYRYANGRKLAQHFNSPKAKEYLREHDVKYEEVMRYIDDTKRITDEETWQIIDYIIEGKEHGGPSEGKYKSIGVVPADRKVSEGNPELANPTLFYDPDLANKDTWGIFKGKATSNSYPEGTTKERKEFNEWARDRKNEIFNLMVNTKPFELSVPEKYGGTSRFNPNGESLLEWWAENHYYDRRLHSMVLGPHLQFHSMWSLPYNRAGIDDILT